MAAMRPKHVATNHFFVALNFVSFTFVVYDVNIYIYIYIYIPNMKLKNLRPHIWDDI